MELTDLVDYQDKRRVINMNAEDFNSLFKLVKAYDEEIKKLQEENKKLTEQLVRRANEGNQNSGS